jgi:ABC-type oligopeptide transport system substrate-binding subunit
MLAFACGGSQNGSSQQLAGNQTYNFPLVTGGEISTLDPGHVSDAVSISFVDEMFAKLLRFDRNHKVVPYVAQSLPETSSDGLTYTFHLRPNATFSNGDKITSQDVLYSWNRVAQLQDSYATVFQPVAGYSDVASGKAQTMSGLTAPDPNTVVAKLQAPAGYWLTEVAFAPSALVDQKAIQQGGADTWWTKPQTAVGAGPFKLTQYTPNASLDFQPVKAWWGGSTGTLTHVHADEGVDGSSAVKKYESGGYSTIGPANQQVPRTDILRYKNDPTKQNQLHLFGAGRSEWLGFNYTGSSPFAPKPGIQPGQQTQGLGQDDGKNGRDAFSLAINRSQLVDVGCAKGTTCKAGNSGYIPPNLSAALGPNSDPSATANASKAKAEYQKWDPTGSKVQGLKLEYNTSPQNDPAYQNVQSQLKQNLGVNVQLQPTDFKTLIHDRQQKQPTLFRDSWSADYDHPQDWFDNLWSCTNARSGGNNNSGYCDPSMDQVVTKGDQQPLDQSLNQYKQAQQSMIKNNYGGELWYQNQPFLTQPYVQGAGYDGLYDYPWEGIRIMQH